MEVIMENETGTDALQMNGGVRLVLMQNGLMNLTQICNYIVAYPNAFPSRYMERIDAAREAEANRVRALRACLNAGHLEGSIKLTILQDGCSVRVDLRYVVGNNHTAQAWFKSLCHEASLIGFEILAKVW